MNFLPRAAAVALVALLTACSPVSTVVAPTNEPVAVEAPAPRIDVECGEFLTGEQLAAATGIAASDLVADDLPMTDGRAASLQAGTVECDWAGPELPGASNAAVWLEILPEAVDEYRSQLRQQQGLRAIGELGRDSRVQCNANSASFDCRLLFLAAEHWVSLEVYGISGTGATEAELETRIGELGIAVRDVLADAPPLGARFVVPEGALARWESCDVVDGGKGLRTAIGSAALLAPEADDYEVGTASYVTSFHRGGLSSCSWSQVDPYVTPSGQASLASVDILPGAGWAWPAFVESALEPQGETMPVGEKLDVAGADDALITCSDANNCDIEALVRGSYVSFDVSFDEGENARDAAQAGLEFILARLR